MEEVIVPLEMTEEKADHSSRDGGGGGRDQCDDGVGGTQEGC